MGGTTGLGTARNHCKSARGVPMSENDVQIILRDIDRAIEPSKMSKQQAIDFLEELLDDLEYRIEALREEIA